VRARACYRVGVSASGSRDITIKTREVVFNDALAHSSNEVRARELIAEVKYLEAMQLRIKC